MPEREGPPAPEPEEAEDSADEEEYASAATDAGAAGGSAGPWQRLRHGFLRPGRSQFILAVVLGLVALAVVMQVRDQQSGAAYTTARRADLIQMGDGLAQENRRLEREIAELEGTKRELESGSDAQQVAREQAQRRVDALSVLAGTVPAEGPGVRITITDPQHKIGPSILIDAVGEMRDAGAEVIEFNDTARVIAQTWIAGTPGALQVDGTPLPDVIVLDVIGDPHALDEAARFRGGLTSQVTAATIGGSINVQRLDVVEIDSIARPAEHEFARPAR